MHSPGFLFPIQELTNLSVLLNPSVFCAGSHLSYPLMASHTSGFRGRLFGELLFYEGLCRNKARHWLHIKMNATLWSCTGGTRRATLQQYQALSSLVSENCVGAIKTSLWNLFHVFLK